MQSYGQPAASRRPNVLFAKTPELIRTYHPLAKLVVGLADSIIDGAELEAGIEGFDKPLRRW
ncbi:MAG: hypothetical protein ABSG55_00580 [Dehalococcoidia bacterium]|jgi:hypothetical protein